MNYDRCIVHYAEIGTKSGNRPHFERLLARNVATGLRGLHEVRVRRETGRLSFSLEGLEHERLEAALAAVARLPGVAWLSPAVRTDPTLAAISAATVALAERDEGSFKISARRSDKRVPFRSRDVLVEVGAAVQRATGRPVDVHSPAVDYRVEVDLQHAYVHAARRDGPGGLPVGSAGTVVSLLSGGLDSPVATYRMMVRGCSVVCVHLWNRGYSGDGVREKVVAIAERLARFHGPLPLLLVPFEDIQNEIVAAAPAELRMLLYRRAMLRVADMVRVRRKAVGTGGRRLRRPGGLADAAQPVVGVGDRPPARVLAPLAGTNKIDVVHAAQEIGTFEPSTRPGQDCCSLLVAKHPKTSSTAGRLRAVEEHYDLDALCSGALSAAEELVLAPAHDVVRRQSVSNPASRSAARASGSASTSRSARTPGRSRTSRRATTS